MGSRKSKTTKTTKETYFTCGRCKIDSLTKDRMCPCPRGSCEAKVAGTVVTQIERTIYKRK